MKNSIGIDSRKLTREASRALRPQPAISGGAGVPAVAVFDTAAMIFFWFGQMISQTFRNMMMPSTPPMPSAIARRAGTKPAHAASVSG